MVTATAIAIAKKLIIESQEVGQQEMSIRRTNAGIAGSIATKISNRSKYDENFQQMAIGQQAEKLANWLDAEEIEYAENVWKWKSKTFPHSVAIEALHEATKHGLSEQEAARITESIRQAIAPMLDDISA